MGKKYLDSIRKIMVLLIMAMFLAFLGLTAGCSKEGGCLTNTGPVISEERTFESDFDTITVNDYINVILTQDTRNSVWVESGRNIISGITTEVINRNLIIHNRNTCNWLRSYDSSHFNVHISTKNLRQIYYNSSGDIRSTNTISPADTLLLHPNDTSLTRKDTTKTLNIDVWGGCGTIDLKINIDLGGFSLNLGTVDLRLDGFCYSTSVYSGGYGLYDGKHLKTMYTYLTSKSSNDCYVDYFWYLDATILSIGNVYYRGISSRIYQHGGGAGKLIQF